MNNEIEIFDIIINKLYSKFNTYDEKIEAMYADLSATTEYLFAYGNDKEKALRNYCKYKEDVVVGYYKRRGL